MNYQFHIIQVIADAGPGGAPRHVIDLIRGLPAALPGATTSLIAPRGWITNAAKGAAEVRPTQLTSAISRRSHRAFRNALDTALQRHSGRPTLVHFHGVRAGSLGYLATRYHGRRPIPPLVYTEHLWTRDYHLGNRLRELLQLRLLAGLGHRFTRVIAVSHAVSNFLLERKLVAPERLVVIPNGIAIPIRNTQYAIRNTTKLRIGTIGSLVPLKGYDVLLQALSTLRQQHEDVTLTIVGTGPEQKNLVKLAERLHVTPVVQFVTQTVDPIQVMADWDIFVSTSRSESFGLAIAEAMAAGLPVVATTVGGVPELVTTQTGRLVPPGDPELLARALLELLANPPLRARLGTAAQARIRDHFSVESMATATARVYRDILKPVP